MRVTILERPTPLTAKAFEAHLQKEFERLKGDLAASVKLDDFSRSGWARVAITGEDAEIMTELISNKFGLAASKPEDITVPGTHQTEIIGINEANLQLEIGVESRNLRCMIPSTHLTAQLADGKAMQVKQLVDYYCLYPSVRISARVTSTFPHGLEAWLSDQYIANLTNWVTTGLDRILVFDCYKDEAEAAVLRAHLHRDVVAIESITLTLQSITCKLGTDAVGLIPKLGHVLRKQRLAPFLPKRILDRCRPW